MKGDHKNYPVSLITVVFVAILIVAFINVAWGSGDCDGHGNCTDDDVFVDVGSTSLNIEGDKSRVYAFSHSLGDVDINDYLVTKAKGNALWSWQNYDYNFWAMADRADLGGKHTEAAELRCLVKDVANHFGDRCVSALTFLPMIIEMPAEIHDTEDDDDAYREVQTYMGELESRMDKLDAQRQASARRYAQEKQEDQQAAQKVLDAYEEVMQ